MAALGPQTRPSEDLLDFLAEVLLVTVCEGKDVVRCQPEVLGEFKAVRAHQGARNYVGPDFLLNLQRGPLLNDLEAELQPDHPTVHAKREQHAEKLLRSEGEAWRLSIMYIRDVTSIWDVEDFMIPNRLPADIGTPTKPLDHIVGNDQPTWAGDSNPEHAFSTSGLGLHTGKGFLNMPIKAPRSDVVLPPELLAQPEMRSLVQDGVAFETLLRDMLFRNEYPDLRARVAIALRQDYGIDLDERVAFLRGNNWMLFDDYFSYLTIDRSAVQPGKAQRFGGFHLDGIQGNRYPDKFPNDHSYIWANRDPTTFVPDVWNCPKDVHGNPDFEQNWHQGPGSMTESFGPRRGSMPTGRPGTLHAMSGLQIHEASKAPADTPAGAVRMFIRLDFLLKHFHRHGDFANPRLGVFEKYTDISVKNTMSRRTSVYTSGSEFGALIDVSQGWTSDTSDTAKSLPLAPTNPRSARDLHKNDT